VVLHLQFKSVIFNIILNGRALFSLLHSFSSSLPLLIFFFPIFFLFVLTLTKSNQRRLLKLPAFSTSQPLTPFELKEFKTVFGNIYKKRD